MNKKFSTLVAMLLASGGLFYAVDAMVLPASEGVAKYVTAVARTTEAGEFTGYSFATEEFKAETSCIWKMVAVEGMTYNLTASAEGKDPYYLAFVDGKLVMQATAEDALPLSLDATTGKLAVNGGGNVLSIKDGVLSLEPKGSEIPAAGLFTSAAAAVTEANVTDALALGTIVPTKNVVDLTTESSLVLNWKAAVEAAPAVPKGTAVDAVDFEKAPKVEFAKSGASLDENIYIKFGEGQFLKNSGGTLSIGAIDEKDDNSAITIDDSKNVKIGTDRYLNLNGVTLTTNQNTAGSQPVYVTAEMAASPVLLTAGGIKAGSFVLFNADKTTGIESASVLTFTPEVKAEPAALDGLKKLADTNLSNAGQGKWSINGGKIKADDNLLLTAADGAAPTLGTPGTDIFLETDGAVRLGQAWLKITSDGIVCSTTEPAAAEKVYLYSEVGKVVKATTDAPNLVISTLTTTDGKSENVSGTVATVAVKLATPADNLPGLDNVTVDTDGKVSAIVEGVSTIPAPFYFNTGKTYLSVTKDKNGNFVIAEGEDAISSENGNQPTGAQSAAASWKLENGKLISVAADRAGKRSYLKAVEVEATRAVVDGFNYTLVSYSEAPTVTLDNGAVKFGNVATTANLHVSATPMDIYEAINTSGDIVVGGTQKSVMQKLYANVPSGYAIVGVRQDDGNVLYLHAAANGTTSVKGFSGSDYKGYLWKVSETNDNNINFYYTFTSLQTTSDGKAIQWKMSDGTTQLTGGAKYNEGFTLSHKTGGIIADGTASNDPAAKLAVIGLYEAPLGAFTKTYLNNILNPGFEMSVEIEKDSKEVLENIDIFSGKMYPAETSPNSNTFVLWNNKDFAGGTDAKMLVLNKASIDGDNAKGAFEWITKKAYDKDPSNYVTDFQFLYDLSNPATDVVSKVKVGSYTLSVLEVEKKFYLTSVVQVTDNTKLPYIKLGANNVYPVKNLVGKLWNISYADTKANAKADDEEYKLNGILAVTYDKDGEYYVYNNNAWASKAITSVADYVASSTVAESAPEAQWIVTSANLNTNTFTLTNRENPAVEITGVKLRLRDGNKFEVYISPVASGSVSTSQSNFEDGDIVYLTESVKKDNFQGYMQTTENTLRSNNYFLGQYHAIDGNHNAYLVENHANSHQIGAVADQEAADKWKLHFAMKLDDDNKYTEVDTVKIITPYATLNAAGNGWETDSKKIKSDTLYILPYTFQKVANREFVAFNPENKTNMDFYACDENNKDNGVGNYTKATRFALKVKPNGYNFVEITTNDDEEYALLSSNKAYLANSANKGSLERMETYAADNNSVMVVEAADASEYHKIAQAWGDTIKLFRDENNAQVMFEKFDAKSIVANDTLSFLNIDNVNQFNVNPAIFADTAYINRWDADGVLNTTYQYLLTLNPSFGLHTEDCEIPGHEPIVGGIDTVYGRFLVNLIDTANVYGVNHIHNNWYINESEAGEKRAKLSFVEGYHTNDTLYLTRQGGEIVKIGMTDPAFNVAKFAFRYVDSDAKTFKIQTQFKEYLGDENEYDSAEEFARAYANNPGYVSSEGYLKWINGTVVVEKGYENGDVFGIEENYAGNPTANENVTVSGISVEATNGAVIIKGAEGKKVSIVNVLGQTIANAVITSSEATIAAPAGVVVVAVEGEAAVKAIVK